MSWKYVRVKAPPGYPGKKYPGGWCLEHHYVWWKETGQLVPKGFHLHHIDENPENNNINNLELLTISDHSKKHACSPALVDLVCPICGVQFTRERRQTHLVKKKQESTCCSRSCSAKKSNR